MKLNNGSTALRHDGMKVLEYGLIGKLLNIIPFEGGKGDVN
jgi:hypothetical protein